MAEQVSVLTEVAFLAACIGVTSSMLYSTNWSVMFRALYFKDIFASTPRLSFKNEMVSTCSMHGKGEECIQSFHEKAGAKGLL
jgi:hypothetical protein